MNAAAVVRFEFATATRIVFGPGLIGEIGRLARELGKRPLIVTGRTTARAERLLQLLRAGGSDGVVFAVAGEPELAVIEAGVKLAREEACDLVIGFGGGSAIDAGKAIAAMLANEGELMDYIEVVGRGKSLVRPSAPYIAIPTTAGTGSEVTRNAVLGAPAHRIKASLRSPHMLARIALVDPELAFDLPPAVTASTGLDALTQLIEPYVSARANPMVDALCVEGIRRAARSLKRACEQGRDLTARSDMSLAALFSGLALANAGLGAVHGLAGPLGGMFPAPHGAVCAALLPWIMAANLQALRARQPANPAVERYNEIARLLTGNPRATADAGVAWTRTLVSDLQIPRLRNYGLTEGDVPLLVAKAAQASSMKANPIGLTPEELGQAVMAAL